MIYMFDTELAEKHGVNQAIILQNIIYWVDHNKENNKHFHDGKYWTYNSHKSFVEQFPFWSESQVKRILKSLIDNGILLVGKHSKVPYFRANWYTLKDSRRNRLMHQTESSHASDGIVSSSRRNRPMDRTESSNAPDEIVQCKTDINNTYKTKLEKTNISVGNSFDSSVINIFQFWLKIMEMPDSFKLNDKRKSAIESRLKDGYTECQIKKAIDGCSKTEWNMGKNPSSIPYNDIELICRDSGRVERFMAVAKINEGLNDDDLTSEQMYERDRTNLKKKLGQGATNNNYN